MKRTLLFTIATIITSLATAQTVLFTETFETYAAGALIAQSNPIIWDTWGHAPGGTEDAPVSTTQAHTGTNSAVFTAAVATGGPNDVLLILGDRTTGSYILDWWMYIPTGKGGYFNIQHLPSLTQYAADFTFLADGTVEVLNSNTTTTGTYTHDAWFQCTLVIDLDAVTASFLVDLAPVHNWQFDTPSTTGAATNALSSIDFYTYAGGAPDLPEFYIDDINFIDVTGVGIVENQGQDAFTVYPVPANDVVTINAAGSTSNASWQLVDMSGRIVLSSTQVIAAQGKCEMDISSIASGMYTLEVLHGDLRERHTIVRN